MDMLFQGVYVMCFSYRHHDMIENQSEMEWIVFLPQLGLQEILNKHLST